MRSLDTVVHPELLLLQESPPHVIERVLNHVSGEISGVAAVYNRHGYKEEKRQIFERWAQCVERLDQISIV